MKHQLRCALERAGVVLPSTPDEVPAAVRDYPDFEREILLWATLEFNLPFADTAFFTTVPPVAVGCSYGDKFAKVLKIMQNEGVSENDD